MKKLLFALVAITTVCCFAETAKFPGWKCTDTTKIDKQISLTGSDAGGFHRFMQLNCLKAVAVNKYSTFDQFKSIIETSVDQCFKNQKYADYFKKIGDGIESKKPVANFCL